MKMEREPFEARMKGNVVEVWIPPIDHPEGERVASFHLAYLDAMIAILKSVQGKR